MKMGAQGALALGFCGLAAGSGRTASGIAPAPHAPSPNLAVHPAAVAAVKGNNLDSMTRDAIEAIGGMGSVVNKGDTVFIKPNFVTFPWARTNRCFHIGECTKPEIIMAAAEECLKAGAGKVVIGDGSQMPTYDWKYSYTLDGSTNMVEQAARLNGRYDGKISLACLEVDYPCDYAIPSRTAHDKLYVSNIYAIADKVISIPVAKTHRWSQLSLGMKNFVGALSIQKYGAFLKNSYWDRGSKIDHSSVSAISQAFLDVVAAKRPDLTIIDFSIGLEGNGPSTGAGGKTVDVKNRLGSWLVLASRDVLAADTVAARAMSHQVPKIKQLTMGYDMGLGQIDEASIEIIGERLADIQMDWAPAILANSYA